MLERCFGRSKAVPLYEYECPSCGTFEQMRRFSDPPLQTCPTCARPVAKRPSAPAIQFKGTGWYITDYARKSAGGEKGEKTEGGSGKDGGGAKEGAPAAASGAKDAAGKGSSGAGNS
jgi:putative FmdB family regulatory protein